MLRRLVLSSPVMVLTSVILCTFVLLGLIGEHPIAVIETAVQQSLTPFGLVEALKRAVPISLCALAASIPAWVGLINIGAEGQFQLGAVGATWAALSFGDANAAVLLPTMVLCAFAAGAAWGGLAGGLRAYLGVNETLITLLLNFVAILFVGYLVHGPWRDPDSFGWPYSPPFTEAAKLPSWSWSGLEMHTGLLIVLLLAVAAAIFRRYTVPGFATHVIRENPRLAETSRIAVKRHIFGALLIGAGCAAIAGMIEVSAVHGRLREGLSPGYGYIGFVVAWLARHNPLGILWVALLVAFLAVAGDTLQVTYGLPYAVVDVLMSVVFISFLISEAVRGDGAKLWR